MTFTSYIRNGGDNTQYDPANTANIHNNDIVYFVGVRPNQTTTALQFADNTYNKPLSNFKYNNTFKLKVPVDISHIYCVLTGYNTEYGVTWPNTQPANTVGHNGYGTCNTVFKMPVWNHSPNFTMNNPSLNTICPGQSVNLSVDYDDIPNVVLPNQCPPPYGISPNTSLNFNNISIKWSANGNSIGNGKNITVSPTTTTTYTAEFRVGNNNCYSVKTVTIEVVEGNPVLSVTPIDACNGTSGGIDLELKQYSNFNWAPQMIKVLDLTTSQQITGLNYTNNGNGFWNISGIPVGQFYLEIDNPNNCPDYTGSKFTVSAQTAPTLNATIGYQPVCHQEVGIINFSGTNGGANSTIKITNIQTQVSTLLTGQYINHFTPSGTYNIQTYFNATPSCVNDLGNFVINPPQSPTPVSASLINLQDPQCLGVANGELEITGTGGAGGYTYAWSNGATGSLITNLVGGTYTCTITDAVGCSNVNSYQLTNGNPGFVVDINPTHALCAGLANGAALASPSVNGSYDFDWSNGSSSSGASSTINNLVSSNYNVTVTDQGTGCQVVANTFIENLGQSEWHKNTQSQSGYDDQIIKTLVDASGNVYALGEFTGYTELDGFGIYAGDPNQKGIFVVKYNECGRREWVVNTNNATGVDFEAIDMEFKPSSNELVFFGKGDIQPQAPIQYDIVLNGTSNFGNFNQDIFAVSINLSSSSISGNDISGSSYTDEILDVEIDDQDYYFAGSFNGIAAVRKSINSNSLSTVFDDQNGGANNTISGIAVDGPNNQLYAIANIASQADFGTGSIPVNGIRETVLIKCDVSNNSVSQTLASEAENAASHDIILASSGQLWITGEYRGALSGWLPSSYQATVNSPFILEFNPANLATGDQFFGAPNASNYSDAKGLALAENNNTLYVAGSYYGSDIEFSDGNTGVPASGGSNTSTDLWLLHINSNSSGASLVEASGSYSWQDVDVHSIATDANGEQAYIGGSYNDQISFGSQTDLMHPGGPEAAGYVVRTGTIFGQLEFYKTGGQTDLQSNQLIESAIANQVLNLYPNPTNGEFTLAYSSEAIGQVELVITDVSGKVIWMNKSEKSSEQFQLNIHPDRLTTGLYFIQVKDSATNSTVKFVVQ